MTKHTVAAVGELVEGQCKLARVGDIEVGVFLIDGEYRAYRNFCPHAGAPLCTASSYERGRAPASLRCPWHGWEFDLRTGTFAGNPRCTLDAYRVEIVDGAVCVWA